MENMEHNNPVQDSAPQSAPKPQPAAQPGYYQPWRPMQVVQPVQPVQPVQQPVQPVQPVQYAQPVQPVQYAQPVQAPLRPVEHPAPPVQPPVPPVQPPKPASEKPRKERSKTAKILLSLLVIAGVILTSSGLTAVILNVIDQRQDERQRLYYNEKVDALQQQIDELQGQVTDNGGELTKPGQTLTAAQIYEKNVDSVVAITCQVKVNEGGQTYEGTSAGSGFVLTADGYVATNHHVIDGATAITVTMHNGTDYEATLIGSDATNDIALLKMEATGLKPVTIGSSSALVVGDQVVAIGNALGELNASLTVGYVSGMDRDISTDGTILNMLQTDVAINSGNSGGPLFNAKGEVIGITTAKYSGTTSSGASIEGISFAIPINDVIGMLDDLRQYGYIKSAFLGIMVRDMDPSVVQQYGFPMGAYVDSVTLGSCAQKAGIQAKDIIVELGGYKIENLGDLSRALRQFEAGQKATVTVWRAGREILLDIVFDEKPQS